MFECVYCNNDYEDEDKMEYDDPYGEEMKPMCKYCSWDIQDGVDLYDNE